MAGNPLINQGTLNRLKGSIVVPGNTALNCTSSYLGKSMISLTLEGNAVEYIPTAAGAVPSQEPYMMATVKFDALKTNGFGNIWKTQLELNSYLGDITVIADTSSLGNHTIANASIESIGELPFDGTSAAYSVTLRGVYYINSAMWS